MIIEFHTETGIHRIDTDNTTPESLQKIGLTEEQLLSFTNAPPFTSQQIEYLNSHYQKL